MVNTHAVLVADRAAKLDEGLTRGRFHCPPLLYLLLRIGQDAEEVGDVEAGAAGVDVGKVGQDEYFFVRGRGPFPYRPYDRLSRWQHLVPTDDRFQGINGDAPLPQIVAQIRGDKPVFLPGMADELPHMHPILLPGQM